MAVVMGIDPGLANLGFGVVKIDAGSMVALDGGVVETPSVMSTERRLHRIHDSVAALIKEHRPVAFAAEQVYFGRNVVSATEVGQAMGVAMLAAALQGIECFSYTPQAVKVAVCGNGGADKEQVQRMVATLLGLAELPRPDHAADALAVAICHAGSLGMRGSLAGVSGTTPNELPTRMAQTHRG